MALERFLDTYQRLNRNNLDLLGAIYSEDVRFSDPAHSLNGLPALRDYFAELYANVDTITFDFAEPHVSGDQVFVQWRMRLRHPRLNRGGEVEVPVLGEKAREQLKIPEGTQSGKVFRLRGKGIRPVRGGPQGDLMVHVVVETPVGLNKRQKELLREFETNLRDSKRSHSPREQGWMDKARGFFDRLSS